jgi:hypothetical protein
VFEIDVAVDVEASEPDDYRITAVHIQEGRKVLTVKPTNNLFPLLVEGLDKDTIQVAVEKLFTWKTDRSSGYLIPTGLR